MLARKRELNSQHQKLIDALLLAVIMAGLWAEIIRHLLVRLENIVNPITGRLG